MTLQRDFIGLPDHVGNYRGGRQAFELSNDIQMRLDAEDFINPYEIVKTLNINITAVGQQATLPAVPEGEIWRVRWLGLGGTADVNTNWYPLVSDGTDSFGLDRFITNQVWSATPVRLFDGLQFAIPFVLRPGWFMAWALRTGPAISASAMDVALLRQRIKI